MGTQNFEMQASRAPYPSFSLTFNISLHFKNTNPTTITAALKADSIILRSRQCIHAKPPTTQKNLAPENINAGLNQSLHTEMKTRLKRYLTNLGNK